MPTDAFRTAMVSREMKLPKTGGTPVEGAPFESRDIYNKLPPQAPGSVPPQQQPQSPQQLSGFLQGASAGGGGAQAWAPDMSGLPPLPPATDAPAERVLPTMVPDSDPQAQFLLGGGPLGSGRPRRMPGTGAPMNRMRPNDPMARNEGAPVGQFRNELMRRSGVR